MRPASPVLMALLLASIPAVADAAPQAGVAAAVRGQITLARAQDAIRAVSSGEQIDLEDTLRSGNRSGMQILLLDETTFTIGPDSEIVIDEFVYDPQTSAGKVGAKVAKGVFRFVTGKIAKTNPSDMNVALPAGNIGIRGTMAAGRTDPVTGESLVVLLGEGIDNLVGDPAGAIDVCNVNVCTSVKRAGYGVRIDGPNSPPSEPFRVASTDLDAILAQMSGSAESGDDANVDDDAVDPNQAGPPPQDVQNAKDAHERLAKIDDLDSLTVWASQDAVVTDEELFARDLVEETSGIDGATTYDQLRSIPNGQFYYAANPAPMQSGNTYSFLLNIDLGAQTYGGGGSFLSLAGTRTGFTAFNTPLSYSASTGNASFVVGGTAVGAGCGTNCTTQLTVRPQNVNGVIAAQSVNTLIVRDLGGVQLDEGTGVTNAQPGFVP